MDDLAKSMNKKVVRRLAGDRYYSRGEEYFQQRRVRSIAPTPKGLVATVRGARDYEVRLEDDDGILDYACDCPIGDEGFFCKHCVAAALAWLDAYEREGRTDAPDGEELTLQAAVDVFLDQDRDRVAELLVEWAQTDPELHAHLLLLAGGRISPDTTFEAVRKTFRMALDPNRFPDEDSWISAVSSGIDMLEDTIPAELSSELVLLCEDALEQVVATMIPLGGPTEEGDDLMRRIEALHYSACLEAKPDPEALAGRLFEWEMRSVYDVFFQAPKRYAKVLGTKGLLRFRELAEEGWSKASKDPQDGDSITLLMLLDSLAEISGTLEERIELMSRDLSGPHRYLQIAQLCVDGDRPDLAIDWAERGRRAFPDDQPSRLTEFAALVYHGLEQTDRAAQITFEEFDKYPTERSYWTFRTFAKSSPDAKQWHDKAVARLRQEVERRPARGLLPAAGSYLLVEALLDGDDVDAAWEAARKHGCYPERWIRLADRREETHPEEAAEVYLEQARRSIKEGSASAHYEPGVELLEKAAAAMKRAGKNREFVLSLQAIQLEHRRKRKLMSLFEKRRNRLYLEPRS